MRILVVGSGGREHALAWKLAQEAEVLVTPGNPGIAEDAECLGVAASDVEGLINVCRERGVDFVVVGPEDPLIEGLADRLREAGVAVFGPGREGAQLEGSKAFSKALMSEAGVTTARFESFTDHDAASDYAAKLCEGGRGCVVKASGNALGKGAIVCDTLDQANDAIRRMMVAREFGDAGDTVVVEERLYGREFSLLTLCSDDQFVSLPVAQDHKRAFDGDQGPNTGGMGSFSPVGWLDPAIVRQAEQNAVGPILAALKRRGISFRGVLFSGFLVQDDVPYCLEYNVRFGDPETQSVLMRLGTGLVAALWACAHGKRIPEPEVLDNAALAVVVASGGYPGGYEKGIPIALGEVPEGVKVFHAGTKREGDHLVTNGGRVVAVTASAENYSEAKRLAYKGVEAVRFEGAFHRKDIGPSV